jgi:hypothetical protein
VFDRLVASQDKEGQFRFPVLLRRRAVAADGLDDASGQQRHASTQTPPWGGRVLQTAISDLPLTLTLGIALAEEK